MSDFNIRSETLNVEQIMEQIRSRIREKRGVDYTEQQIRELAAVKLEKVLDPRSVRSDLLEQFRKAQPPDAALDVPNFSFESSTLFDSHRAIVRFVRRLLLPILKLFFNPNPLIQALHIQARLNTIQAEHETAHRASHHLFYELIHNLVVETTRLAIEVKNLKMRVESLSSRLEFNERRARALESVVVYKSPGVDVRERAPAPAAETAGAPAAPGPRGASPPGPQAQHAEGPGQRSHRRRRRRGRRTGAPASAVMNGQTSSPSPDESSEDVSDHVARDDFDNVSGAALHRSEPVSGDDSAADEPRTPQNPRDAARSDAEPISEPGPPSAPDAGAPHRSEPDDSNSQ
jgi:hypothetical protein